MYQALYQALGGTIVSKADRSLHLQSLCSDEGPDKAP